MAGKEDVLKDIEIIKSDNIAVPADSSHIWDGEHYRANIATEKTAKNPTPIYALLPMLIRQLERAEVELVHIDATSGSFVMCSQTEEDLEFFSAHDIAYTVPLAQEKIKANIGLYFKAYYLLRFYLLGGSKKYAVTKLNEGFMVYANDPENPHVWAGHKVY